MRLLCYVVGLPQFLEKVHKESKSVMIEYNKLVTSGADPAHCADPKIKEFYQLIEKAKTYQYYKNLEQQLKDNKSCGSGSSNGSDDEESEEDESNQHIKEKKESASTRVSLHIPETFLNIAISIIDYVELWHFQ